MSKDNIIIRPEKRRITKIPKTLQEKHSGMFTVRSAMSIMCFTAIAATLTLFLSLTL